ncbi:MAG: two-component sensor histidine kinase [Acidobacteria bacterium]|nr:MAG: two-component sensor histidine kinase [Acidobacteriota bacterium]
MRKLSIGMRLTLWYLAIFALAQLVFGAGMWLVLRHHLYDLVDDNLEREVDDLNNLLHAQKTNKTLAGLRHELTEEYALEHSGDYLQVYLADGEMIYQSPFLQAYPLHRWKPGTVTPAVVKPGHRRRPSYEDLRLGGKPLRFATQDIDIEGTVYIVQTGLITHDVLKTLSRFRLYLLMFAPMLLLVAAGGGYWLSRRALSPVDALVRTARSITGTTLSSRLEKLNTGDELQRLSDTLNEMLDRIELAFRRVTQFTADASHELRTPISLVRTEAELALRRSRGESEYKEALQHILLEAERTTSLIEELLALARADAGRETLNLHPVDVREILREVVEGWRRVAKISNLQFSDSIEARESLVLADEAALRRAIDILLDNAFKYTPSPGTVHLSLEQQNDKVVITVRDTGVGIAAEEQGKVFERFYRVDKARSRDMGGAGLGLSIAQWIVQQHAGKIEVESSLSKGSIFRVELPLTTVALQNPLPA